MPDVDDKLVGLLRQAKNAPMFFAFVAKGASDGALIVAKKKIPVKEINEAKDICGGKVVIKGLCQGEDGKMVFKVAKEPPSTLAKAIKTVIQRDAGMNLQTEVRVAADVEEGEGESEGEGDKETVQKSAPKEAPSIPAAPPPPPVDLSGKFTTRLKALLPVMQKAESLGSPLATEAKAKIAEANKLFVGKQIEQALGVIDQAETLLKKALATAGKPATAPPATAPPATAPPPPSPSADLGGLVKRLNGLTASIKTAMAGPTKAQVQTLFTSVQDAIKNKDTVGGTKALDQLENLLAQPAGETESAETESAGENAGENAGADAAAAEWHKKLAAIEPKYLEGLKDFGGDVGKLRTLFSYAQEQAEAGQFAQAVKVLGRLEEALAKGAGSKVGAIPAGLVKYRQSLLGFEAAVKKAQAQFLQVQQTIASTLPEENETGQDILDYFDGLRSELMDSIDQAISKAADEREPINDAIRSNIRTKIAQIQGDTLIQFLDKNKLAPTTIASTLVGALNQIVTTMV